MWGVTRGAENTTPVTHATGFTIQQVVTAGALQNFTQYPNSGPTAATSIAASGTFTMATYVPPATDVPSAGIVYDFTVFGGFNHSAVQAQTIAVTWNATTIASMIGDIATTRTGTVSSPMTLAGFWLEGKVCCFGASTMTCGMNFQSYTSGTQAVATIATLVGASTAGVTISGTAGPLSIVAVNGSDTSYTVSGYLIHRIS